MEKLTIVTVFFGIVFVSLFMTVCVADSCPSPSVVYASQGDNITICWKLIPEANSSALIRFTVMTLHRPVEEEMKKVASATSKGELFKVYDRNHDGVYKDRVTLDADLQEKNLFFRIAHYTSKMANVYCVFYEMSGSNNIQTCHISPVFLRDTVDNEFSGTIPSTVKSNEYSSKIPRTVKRNMATTLGKAPTTHGERSSIPYSYKGTFIIVVCLSGVLTLLTVVSFVLYCRARKSRKTNLQETLARKTSLLI